MSESKLHKPCLCYSTGLDLINFSYHLFSECVKKEDLATCIYLFRLKIITVPVQSSRCTCHKFRIKME